MLELFGRGYVIDHCIATYSRRTDEINYRVYVTDCLQGLAAAYNMKAAFRYYDTLHRSDIKEETRTPEEIIQSIGNKLDALGRK